ncbi:MAG: hypothetical protein HQL04_05870, partial [Nitrospirae bacterium]|nr:hypothetical protein [Nitrospirota bacterium]
YLKGKQIDILLTDRVKEVIAESGYDPVYGARPLRRVLQSEILNPLALKILDGSIVPGDTVRVDYERAVMVFSKVEMAMGE